MFYWEKKNGRISYRHAIQSLVLFLRTDVNFNEEHDTVFKLTACSFMYRHGGPQKFLQEPRCY